jgi:hypothetical protein
LARKSEDDEGDERRMPGWWKSWPSVCWAGNICVVAIVMVVRGTNQGNRRQLLSNVWQRQRNVLSRVLPPQPMSCVDTTSALFGSWMCVIDSSFPLNGGGHQQRFGVLSKCVAGMTGAVLSTVYGAAIGESGWNTAGGWWWWWCRLWLWLWYAAAA